jgi:SIR2-like domain
MEMIIPEALVQAVRERKAVLFVGAGLSCTLGLPLFDVLTSYLGSQLNLPDWERYEFPALTEYYLLEKSSSDELFRWMRERWHPDDIDITASKAHNCILDLDFPVLYTTNYDSWLECAFAARGVPFRKILNVNNLAEACTNETEIIKFHGDFDDPTSIVLTESSFLQRMSLDGPLDIRLRSDSLARPLLFAGYSVSDPNIRYLLFRLQQLWAGYSEPSKKPKSYILMVERNEVQERILCERGIEPIVLEESDASLGLIHFFEALLQAVQSDHVGNG